jgi:recombination protein RecT
VQTNPSLAECTNKSLLNAALLGQSLDLPQSPQLGMFYMIPYDNKKTGVKEAQFQISYKGLIQLAIRSGQYKKLHVTDIREGELKYYNAITDEYTFTPETDMAKRINLKVIGYYAYFELVNGYKKDIYWSREQMEEHAKKYSVSYRKGWDSVWKSDFDRMAFKTLIKQLLSRYGVMSVEMSKAVVNDQAVLEEENDPKYVDNVDIPERGINPFTEGGVIDVEENEISEVEDEAAEVFPK